MRRNPPKGVLCCCLSSRMIEIQGYYDAAFEKRMFVYYYRIFDRYNAEVASLAVLSDANPKYRPCLYRKERWGCEIRFQFPAVKVSDYGRDWEALEQNANPFSTVVMAHLRARSVKEGGERLRWKLRIVRLLYERGYGRKDILELFRFIDWLLVLPEELEKSFSEEIIRMEEEKKMPYITSVERIGIEKGYKIGSLEEARDMVLEAVAARFGVIPEEIVRRVKSVETKETLRSLLRQAVVCESLDKFREILLGA